VSTGSYDIAWAETIAHELGHLEDVLDAASLYQGGFQKNEFTNQRLHELAAASWHKACEWQRTVHRELYGDLKRFSTCGHEQTVRE
jgi:hypothetical protein